MDCMILQHTLYNKILPLRRLCPRSEPRSRPRRPNRRPRPGAPETLQGNLVPAQTLPQLARAGGRPRKEGSFRKRIAKYAKPLAQPKLRTWAGAGRSKPTRAAKRGRKPQDRSNPQLAGQRTTTISKAAPCLLQAQYQAFRIASRTFQSRSPFLDSGIWTVLKRGWWCSQW